MVAAYNIDQYKFHYIDAGDGDHVVLVHGSTSDYRTWEHQVAALGRQFHTVAYSRRYHWPNEGIEEGVDYSMQQHVDDLGTLLHKLGDKPVHLVGHSYGAFVCLLLAMQSPEQIRTLVLAEPPAITLYMSNKPKPTEILKLLFTRPRTAVSLIRFAARGLIPATKAVKKGDTDKAIHYLGKATLGKDAFAALSKSRMDQVRENMFKMELLGSGFPPLQEEQIRQVHLPTLLVYGENSPAMFHALQHRLAQLMPNASEIIIENASHLMHEDNPDNYNFSVRHFLEKHSA